MIHDCTPPSLPATYAPLQEEAQALLTVNDDLWIIYARNDAGVEGWLIYSHNREVLFLLPQEHLTSLDILLSNAMEQIEKCKGTHYERQYPQRLQRLRVATNAYELYEARSTLDWLNLNPRRRWGLLKVEGAQICKRPELVGAVVAFVTDIKGEGAQAVYYGGVQIGSNISFGPSLLLPVDTQELLEAKALESATLELTLRHGYQDVTQQEVHGNGLRVFRHQAHKWPLVCHTFDQVIRLLEEVRIENH